MNKKMLWAFRAWMYYTRGYSLRTVQGAMAGIKKLVRMGFDPFTTDPEDLRDYLFGKMPTNTRRKVIHALRLFHEFLDENGLNGHNGGE